MVNHRRLGLLVLLLAQHHPRGKTQMQLLSFFVGFGSLVLLAYTLATQMPFVRSLFELIAAPVRLLGGYIQGIGHVAGLFLGKQEERMLQSHTLRAWWPTLRSLIVGLL
jgi:hypothetical protein